MPMYVIEDVTTADMDVLLHSSQVVWVQMFWLSCKRNSDHLDEDSSKNGESDCYANAI